MGVETALIVLTATSVATSVASTAYSMAAAGDQPDAPPPAVEKKDPSKEANRRAQDFFYTSGRGIMSAAPTKKTNMGLE